jgi:hypothetical protein
MVGYARSMAHRTRNITLLLAICACACGVEKGGPDGTTTAADTTGETIGMSSASTGEAATGPAPTTGEAPATASTTGADTTSADVTGTVTTGDGTTTDVNPGTQMRCQAFCDRRDECRAPGPGEACVQECLDELAQLVGPCKSATQVVLVCFTELTCEQFLAAVNDDDPGPCADVVLEQEQVCEGADCSIGGGGDVDGDECLFTRECPDQPLQRMECDKVTCNCFVDGAPVGSCDAEGVCLDLDGLAAKAAACCGF